MHQENLPEPLLTTRQAAEILHQTKRFMEGRRLAGDGPRFIKISSRSVRYRISDLMDWIEARAINSTVEGIR